MKWKKFVELRAQYPHIGNDLTHRGGRNDTKEFVRTMVGYIAHRPFESLDLSSKYSSSSTALKSKFLHTTMECFSNVEYQISFHVEGEVMGSRLRYVNPDIGDGSIQAHVEDVSKWFETCEDFRGKQLVWERVVKRTVSGSSHCGLTQMNLDIYLFPRDYRFKQLPQQLQSSSEV